MDMKRIFILLLCVFAVAGVDAQELLYKIKADVTYTSSSDEYAQERCKLDVYYPEGAKGCPVVVWFHAGGLTSGEKYIPMQLQESGLVVVAVNYRLIPKVSLGECIDDAAEAVAWVFAEVEKFGGDIRKIFVSGHSAGGYLTSMLGLDKHWLAKYSVDADSIAGLAPFSGQAITHFAHREQKGIKSTQPVIDELAPLFHVRPDAPPLIIVSGDRNMELLGRYEESAYFWRMMKISGHQQTFLYELDGYDHGDMVEPAFHILKDHIRLICGGK